MGSTEAAEQGRGDDTSAEDTSADGTSADETSAGDSGAEGSGAGGTAARGTGDDSSGSDGDDSADRGGAETADPAEMEDKYEPGKRPTVVMPGTRGAVSGTAFADEVDDVDEAVKNPAVEDPWIASEHADDEDQQPRGGDDEDGGTENVATASGDADKSHGDASEGSGEDTGEGSGEGSARD